MKYALAQQKKNVPAPKKTEQEKLIDKLEYFNDGKNRLSSRTGDTPTNTYVAFPELLVFYTRGLVHIKYSESPPLKTVYSKVCNSIETNLHDKEYLARLFSRWEDLIKVIDKIFLLYSATYDSRLTLQEKASQLWEDEKDKLAQELRNAIEAVSEEVDLQEKYDSEKGFNKLLDDYYGE